MNTIVNTIIKNTIALRNANASSLKAASANQTTPVDNGLSMLNSGKNFGQAFSGIGFIKSIALTT